MRFIQGISREQKILFPESVDDYIAEGNPVQFIDAFVNSLDLAELGFKHAEYVVRGIFRFYKSLPNKIAESSGYANVISIYL